MSDFSHLLADPSVAEAIHAHVRARPDHKVVGLHDEVLVRDEIVQRRTDLSTLPLGAPLTSEAYVVRSYSEPYPTVEVILATMTGRIYARRYRGSLHDFLAAAEVVKEVKAS